MVPREEAHHPSHEDMEVLTSHKGMDVALDFAETSKKRRSRMIDESYNRYTFGDKNLPDWFREDESKHNRPLRPESKEEMRMLRDKLRMLDSRPIKKVLEAKARNKRRAESNFLRN